jgi:hypothetical protein
VLCVAGAVNIHLTAIMFVSLSPMTYVPVTATATATATAAVTATATPAPYVKMDMNPVMPALGEDAGLVYKDAIIFSGHKFVGEHSTAEQSRGQHSRVEQRTA